MLEINKKVRLLILVQLFCFLTAMGWSQNVNLKVVGNSQEGFNVAIYDGTKLVLQNTEEFKLNVANSDLSETSEIKDWKGSKWTGNDSLVTLSRDTYLSDFDLDLSISVTYKIINSNIVKKSIDLFQSGMPLLYYTLEENFIPAEIPSKYVTFENDDFPGGFAHEMFLSAGFITPDNQVVGVLMEAGYKNHYTRSTRRRFNGHGGGFVGIRKLPDVELLSVASLEERANGNHYIQQRYGEMYNLDAGNEMPLKITAALKKVGEVDLKNNQSGLITLKSKVSGRSGFEVIVPFKDQKVYTGLSSLAGTNFYGHKLYI